MNGPGRAAAVAPAPRAWAGPTLWVAGAGLVLALALIGDLAFGRRILGPGEVWGALTRPDETIASILVWDLRLPRAILGALCGASLAVAGALMQGVVQNDLAVPELTGVTGGAAFAVVVASLWFGVPAGLQPVWGLIGGVAAAATTVAIAWNGAIEPLRLTLAGLAVAALSLAGTKAALVLAGPQAGTVFFWLVGGFANRSWAQVAIVWPWVLAGLAAAFASARVLDVLALGEDHARSLGVAVTPWRIGIVGASIALTVATVSVAGPIAFVGLTVPHVARGIVGRDHARLLPLSALLGAALLASADLAARLLGGSYELPVGMMTALIGGPILLRIVGRRT